MNNKRDDMRLSPLLRARAMAVARQRLSEMPGAYDAFVSEVDGHGQHHSVQSVLLSPSFQLAHLTNQATLAMALAAGEYQQLDPGITEIVDDWARSFQQRHPVQVAPLAPGPQSTLDGLLRVNSPSSEAWQRDRIPVAEVARCIARAEISGTKPDDHEFAHSVEWLYAMQTIERDADLRVIDHQTGQSVAGTDMQEKHPERYSMTRAHFGAFMQRHGFAQVEDAPEEQPATPIADVKTNEPVAELERLKRRALILAHRREWPAIETHLKSAHRNGLAKAAKVGGGYWSVGPALKWARQHGYLQDAAPAVPLVHRLEG